MHKGKNRVRKAKKTENEARRKTIRQRRIKKAYKKRAMTIPSPNTIRRGRKVRRKDKRDEENNREKDEGNNNAGVNNNKDGHEKKTTKEEEKNDNNTIKIYIYCNKAMI